MKKSVIYLMVVTSLILISSCKRIKEAREGTKADMEILRQNDLKAKMNAEMIEVVQLKAKWVLFSLENNLYDDRFGVKTILMDESNRQMKIDYEKLKTDVVLRYSTSNSYERDLLVIQ